MKLDQFRQVAPPMFRESMSPIEAYRWLRDMDKTFASLEYSDSESPIFCSSVTREGTRLVEDGRNREGPKSTDHLGGLPR